MRGLYHGHTHHAHVRHEYVRDVLVEVARHDRGNRHLPERLAAEFERFYADTWVAEALVDFAISAEEPPVDELRRRYAAVGNDLEALPMDFGEAMRILTTRSPTVSGRKPRGPAAR